MTKLAAFSLALLSVLSISAYADDWWQKSDRSLNDYLSDGYVVVGFATDLPAGALGGSGTFRYVLQKLDGNKTLLSMCSETSRGTHQKCYDAISSGDAPY